MKSKITLTRLPSAPQHNVQHLTARDLLQLVLGLLPQVGQVVACVGDSSNEYKVCRYMQLNYEGLIKSSRVICFRPSFR